MSHNVLQRTIYALVQNYSVYPTNIIAAKPGFSI